MKCLDMPHFTQCGVLLVTDMIEPAVLAAAERQGEAPSAHSRKECFRKVPAISEIIDVQPGLRC
ncbi:hypothetical protein FN854_23500 [Escherichia coli]|nr:hypothetical protein [Escherichia coli]